VRLIHSYYRERIEATAIFEADILRDLFIEGRDQNIERIISYFLVLFKSNRYFFNKIWIQMYLLSLFEFFADTNVICSLFSNWDRRITCNFYWIYNSLNEDDLSTRKLLYQSILLIITCTLGIYTFKTYCTHNIEYRFHIFGFHGFQSILISLSFILLIKHISTRQINFVSSNIAMHLISIAINILIFVRNINRVNSVFA